MSGCQVQLLRFWEAGECVLEDFEALAEGVDRGLAAKSILVLENGQFAPVPGRDREEY